MRRYFLRVAILGLVAGLAGHPAPAQDLDLSLEESHEQIGLDAALHGEQAYVEMA